MGDTHMIRHIGNVSSLDDLSIEAAHKSILDTEDAIGTFDCTTQRLDILHIGLDYIGTQRGQGCGFGTVWPPRERPDFPPRLEKAPGHGSALTPSSPTDSDQLIHRHHPTTQRR